MGNIRIELEDAAAGLEGVEQWLKRFRGKVVHLDRRRRIALGAPITGARAVLSAVVLEDDQRPGPQLGGVVRALAGADASSSVRFVFEGRSPAGLSAVEAEDVAIRMLEDMSRQIVSGEAVADVA